MFDQKQSESPQDPNLSRGKKDKKMAKNSIEKKQLALVHSKKDDTKSKLPQLGSARGIESMFRNSYRAQLDMIALAATKANIMISLNGVLVSVLLVSGAYFLATEPMLIVPFASFLVTCTVAIVFAVLAARPVVDRRKSSLEDFRADRADLLIFEQFAGLSREDYLEAMMEMLQNNDRVYKNMIVHIHDLGRSADRKFARLRVSYSAFMIGLVISVALLLIVIARGAFVGV